MAFQLRALGSSALSPEIGLALSSPRMLAPRMLAQDAGLVVFVAAARHLSSLSNDHVLKYEIMLEILVSAMC